MKKNKLRKFELTKRMDTYSEASESVYNKIFHSSAIWASLPLFSVDRSLEIWASSLAFILSEKINNSSKLNFGNRPHLGTWDALLRSPSLDNRISAI